MYRRWRSAIYRFALGCLGGAPGVLLGAELKVVTEYRYPTEYRVIPVGGIRNGTAPILGGIVEPSRFETREGGAILRVEASAFPAGVSSHRAAEFLPSKGTTPLMMAAAQGNYDRVLTLVAHGASVNAQNRCGSTALMAAAAGGFEDIVRLLLHRGADPNRQNARGRTALMFAARNGHLGTVRLLFRGGADIHQTDAEGNTALVYAVQEGHRTVAEWLARVGASVHARNVRGENGLDAAAHREDRDLVLLLTRIGRGLR